MPRDVNGNYTLPLPNVVAGTTIEDIWANTQLPDIASGLTDSLSRSGSGGMLAPLPFVSGNVNAPGFAWSDEPTTGFYRAAAGDMRLSVTAADLMRFRPGSIQRWVTTPTPEWREMVHVGGVGAVPDTGVDGETLRYEEDSAAWVASSALTIPDTGEAVVATALGVNVTPETGYQFDVLADTMVAQARVKSTFGGAALYLQATNVTDSILGLGDTDDPTSHAIQVVHAADTMRIIAAGSLSAELKASETSLYGKLRVAPVGTDTPFLNMSVGDTSATQTGIQIYANNVDGAPAIWFGDQDSLFAGAVGYSHATDELQFTSGGGLNASLDSVGRFSAINLRASALAGGGTRDVQVDNGGNLIAV